MTHQRSHIQLVARDAPDAGAVTPKSPKALFLANYESMRELASNAAAGVALVAVDTRSACIVDSSWIGRDADRPSSLVIGSHKMCDVVLSDPTVELRHIAVLAPAGDARIAEFSLHDLHTGQDLALDESERIPASTMYRFGVVQLGPYMLFTFATGIDGTWSDIASDAWVDLGGGTTTVYRNKTAEPSPPTNRPPNNEPVWAVQAGSSMTIIQGPLRTSDTLVQPGEQQVAELRVRASERVDRLALGPSALERGVLVGRSDRCASVLTNNLISRVHVLVIATDDEIIAVDTASTNGVFRDREATDPARVVMLSRGERATLMDENASVSLRMTPADTSEE